jgi:3-hydroxyacyl-CoA dehydrogenase
MTSGRPIGAAQAKAAGFLDEVFEDNLEQNALAWCEQLLAEGKAPVKVSEKAVPEAEPGLFDAVRTELAKRARGQLAPFKIVDCVEAATRLAYPEGAAFERERFLECMASPQSAAMRHLFFAEREAAKVRDLPPATGIREIQSVAVIGGGTMGGGIAMSCANAGLAVTLLEIDAAALERGFGVIEGNYAKTVKKGRLSPEEAKNRRGRITGTTDYDDLADVDLVIEAVFEDPDLKKTIFKKLDRVCKTGAILATNTSYQDVDAIAAATGRPEDCLGMHFFSPANVMKLLEVVRGEKTADDVLATAIKFAKAIRKVPVVARVCYGFIGNRMFNPYIREAQKLLLEGALPETVDAALFEFGMAMGPIAVSDLAGLDVGYKARMALPESLRGDETPFRVADELVESGRLGQKTGAGFYTYDPETRRGAPDPAVTTMIEAASKELGIERRVISAEEVVERTVFALVNEGLKVLDEGIAQRPGDIDIVYLYGYGFPVHRGGPMFYADQVGLEHVLTRVREFHERFGSDAPAPLLERLVAEGQSIADWARTTT